MTSKPLHILLVDDEPVAAQALERMLKLLGHNIHTVHESGDMVRFLQRQKPDIIFMDMNMPGFDGLELCNYVRHDPRLSDVPVVFNSLDDQESTIKAAYAAGAAGYLVKPVEFQELETTLQRVLG
jgi:CheY-like chemotaxis protein